MSVFDRITDLFRTRPKVADALVNAHKAVDAMAARSVRDGLINAASGLGGSGDKAMHSAWAPSSALSRQTIEDQFRSDWLSRQIVTVPAADATREWVTHKAPSSEDFATKMVQAETKFNVRERVYEAEWNARCYGGSVIFLGVSKGADVMELREPFDYHTTKKGQLRYLRVLDRWRAQGTGTLDSQLESPNFDFPEFYDLANGTSVHYTRIVRFDGDILPWNLWTQNNRWNDSVLQSSNDAIKAVNTAQQAIVSMIHEANFDIVHSPDLAMLAAQGEGSALRERWSMANMMKSWMHVLLLDKEETYETRQRSFAELSAIMEKLQINVSGAADIPFTRLYGQSPAGLTATGESDLQNYYNAIASNQETKLRPRLSVIFEVLARSEIGDLPDDYTFTFNPLLKEASSVKATTEATEASTAKTYVDMGALKPSTVARRLKQLGQYEITDDDIKELETAEEEGPEPQYPEDPNDPQGEPPEDDGEGGEDGGEDPALEKDTSNANSAKDGSLVASPKDAFVLSEADDALDAFDLWTRTLTVDDGWEDQPRDEFGRWSVGGALGAARSEHVEARNAFAESTKKKDSLRGKVSRARAALAKAVESGHSAKIQAVAQRLHEHVTAHTEHVKEHGTLKDRVKSTTKGLKEAMKAPKAPKAPKPKIETLNVDVKDATHHADIADSKRHMPEGVHEYLARQGKTVTFIDRSTYVDAKGAKTSAYGTYNPSTGQIRIGADLNDFQSSAAVPGSLWSISKAAKTRSEKLAITLTHEGAHAAHHDLLMDNSKRAQALLNRIEKAHRAQSVLDEPAHVDPKTGKTIPDRYKAAGKDAFSKYAHKNEKEFIAEAVAAYHHNPDYLHANNPTAYALAHDFVKHTGYGKTHAERPKTPLHEASRVHTPHTPVVHEAIRQLGAHNDLAAAIARTGVETHWYESFNKPRADGASHTYSDDQAAAYAEMHAAEKHALAGGKGAVPRIFIRTNREPIQYDYRAGTPPLVPGSKTVGAYATTLIHESAHIAHGQLNAAVKAGDKRAAELDRALTVAHANAQRTGQAISIYARENRQEYLAETVTGYHVHPEELRKRDPDGYALAHTFVVKQGLGAPNKHTSKERRALNDRLLAIK